MGIINKKVVEQPQQQQQYTQGIPGLVMPPVCKHDFTEVIFAINKKTQGVIVYCKNCGDAKRLY